jgi:NADH dehydrogenase [ubiquinone] 1 alpha subcomplex assembly factor 1
MTSVLFDFSDPGSAASWNPINDGVMGGVSRSQLRHDPAGHAVFAGQVSFENNGGFASVRCQPCDLGRKDVIAYRLEVRGDGKRYKLNLRTDNSFDGVNYQVGFLPPMGIWTTCRLASTDFLPNWRGRSVPDAPSLDTGRLRQIGLMIADRQEGPFALAVRSIAVEIV